MQEKSAIATTVSFVSGVSGKKRKAEDDATPPPEDNNRLKPDKRIKAEPEPEKKEGQRCENCGITFSKPTAYKAHVEFYCQKKIKKEWKDL